MNFYECCDLTKKVYLIYYVLSITVVFVFFVFVQTADPEKCLRQPRKNNTTNNKKKAGQYLICAKWQSHAKMSRRLIQQKWLLKMASFQVKDQFPDPSMYFVWQSIGALFTCMYIRYTFSVKSLHSQKFVQPLLLGFRHLN